MSDVYGPLRSFIDVERAAVAHLRLWLVAYLAEVERLNSLRPRTLRIPPSERDSYYGGLDHDSWIEEALPALIVIAQPVGPPERDGESYGQMFQLDVAAVVFGEDEDEARCLAGYYGTAIEGAIVQRGSLGTGWIGHTTMVGSPRAEFPDPDIRRLIRCVATFHSWVSDVVSDRLGPASPPVDPYAAPGDFPTVSSTPVTLGKLA